MQPVPQQRDQPKTTFDVVELNEVIQTLNDDLLSTVVYRKIGKRRSEKRFDSEKLPARAVQSARLRHLVDEWLETGTDSDGKHYPDRRNLNRTVEALSAVRTWAASYTCGLRLIEETGELVVVVGWPGSDHLFNLRALDRFRYETTEADRIFTAVMLEHWRHLLSKCVHCGRYFVLPNARRESYPHGTFCCREHQRDQSAARSTKLRRERVARALVQNATTWLLKRSHRAWQENEALKRALATSLSEKMSSNPNLRAGRESVGVKWVTRNSSAIEKELERRNHAKG